MEFKINGQVVVEPDLYDVNMEDIHAEGTGRNEAGIALVIILREDVRQFSLHWTAIEEQEARTLLNALKGNKISITYYDPEEGEITRDFYKDSKSTHDYGNGLFDVSCGFTEI